MKVLLVEDDAELARQLFSDLKEEGFEPRVETDGPGALEAVFRSTWDLVILDVVLPGRSGFEVVESMRAHRLETPVIFLTARGDVADRVRGLSLGGDDYLTKPFARDELMARVQALRRRVGRTSVGTAALPPGWEMNALRREVTLRGRVVPLQPREWSLLEILLRHEGQVLGKSFLLDRVWGLHFDPGTNVVDAVMCRLRRKLDQPGQTSHLQTVRGRGYTFRRNA